MLFLKSSFLESFPKKPFDGICKEGESLLKDKQVSRRSVYEGKVKKQRKTEQIKRIYPAIQVRFNRGIDWSNYGKVKYFEISRKILFVESVACGNRLVHCFLVWYKLQFFDQGMETMIKKHGEINETNYRKNAIFKKTSKT